MDISKFKRDIHPNDNSLRAYLLDAALSLPEYQRKELAVALIASTLGVNSRDACITDIAMIRFDSE